MRIFARSSSNGSSQGQLSAEDRRARREQRELRDQRAYAGLAAGLGATFVPGAVHDAIGSMPMHHGTSTAAGAQIKREGLQPSFGGLGGATAEGVPFYQEASKGHVHVAPGRAVAHAYANLLEATAQGEKTDLGAAMFDPRPRGARFHGALPFEDFHARFTPDNTMPKNFFDEPSAYKSKTPVTPDELSGEIRGLGRVLKKRLSSPTSFVSYVKNNPARFARGVGIIGGTAGAAALTGHLHKQLKEKQQQKLAEPWAGFFAEMAKLASDVNVGQRWEQVGGPHLAKGGDHATFKKMMADAGIPEGFQKKFERLAQEKYPPGHNSRRSRPSPGPAWGSYGAGDVNSAAHAGVDDLFSRQGINAAATLGAISAPILYGALSNKKEDPHTRVPEWRGRLGNYIAAGAPLAGAGYALGGMLGGQKSRLVGAGIGALAGLGSGELLHRSNESSARAAGLRAARTGKGKRLLSEAAKTEGYLTGESGKMFALPLTLNYLMDPAGSPASAIGLGLGAFGQGMAHKRRNAAAVEHYDNALEGMPKAAAGAPTRGGFLMASDIPPFKAPRLDRAIQKEGDMLPDGITYGPGDFKKSKYAAGLVGRMAAGAAIGALGGAGYHGLMERTPSGLPGLGGRMQALDNMGEDPWIGAGKDGFSAMSTWHKKNAPKDWKSGTPYRRGSAVLLEVPTDARDVAGRIAPVTVWGDTQKENVQEALQAFLAQEGRSISPETRQQVGQLVGEAQKPWWKRAGVSGTKYAMPIAELSTFVSDLLKEGSPSSQLHQSQSVGAPKSAAPPGPSIAQIAKPRGAHFGTGIAGAFKNGIGGTAPVGLK